MGEFKSSHYQSRCRILWVSVTWDSQPSDVSSSLRCPHRWDQSYGVKEVCLRISRRSERWVVKWLLSRYWENVAGQTGPCNIDGLHCCTVWCISLMVSVSVSAPLRAELYLNIGLSLPRSARLRRNNGSNNQNWDQPLPPCGLWTAPQPPTPSPPVR